MIRVDRSSSPGPSARWHTKAEHRLTDLYLRFEEGGEPRYDPGLLHEVRPLLTELFGSKCAYCESTLGVTDVSQAELNGETGRPGYWWLAYRR